MQLSHLKVRDFRNLVDIEFEPCTGVNLIYGLNASGKTSLLESIYYLSHEFEAQLPINQLYINSSGWLAVGTEACVVPAR